METTISKESTKKRPAETTEEEPTKRAKSPDTSSIDGPITETIVKLVAEHKGTENEFYRTGVIDPISGISIVPINVNIARALDKFFKKRMPVFDTDLWKTPAWIMNHIMNNDGRGYGETRGIVDGLFTIFDVIKRLIEEKVESYVRFNRWDLWSLLKAIRDLETVNVIINPHDPAFATFLYYLFQSRIEKHEFDECSKAEGIKKMEKHVLFNTHEFNVEKIEIYAKELLDLKPVDLEHLSMEKVYRAALPIVRSLMGVQSYHFWMSDALDNRTTEDFLNLMRPDCRKSESPSVYDVVRVSTERFDDFLQKETSIPSIFYPVPKRSAWSYLVRWDHVNKIPNTLGIKYDLMKCSVIPMLEFVQKLYSFPYYNPYAFLSDLCRDYIDWRCGNHKERIIEVPKGCKDKFWGLSTPIRKLFEKEKESDKGKEKIDK